MDSELEAKTTYTRAKVLKRAGIGAAALYSSPFIVSSAMGATDKAIPGKVCIKKSFDNGLDSPCDTCFNGNIANTCSGACICFVDTKGCCQCRGLGGGCSNPTCNSNADCPAGFKCVLTCCDGGGTAPGARCLPPCTGSEAAASAAELALVRA